MITKVEALSDRDLLEELEDRLERCDQALSALGTIRATLLANFGEGRLNNLYGFTVKDAGSTHALLVRVLEALTANDCGRMSYEEREQLSRVMIERWKKFAQRPIAPAGAG